MTDLAWSPDSRYLVTGAAAKGKIVEVWDVDTKKEVLQLDPMPPNPPNLAEIAGISWSADGKRVAVGLLGFTGGSGIPTCWIQVYEVDNESAGTAYNWQNTATLTYSNVAHWVSWAPDNKQITFAAGAAPGARPLTSTIVDWRPTAGANTDKDTTIMTQTSDGLESIAWSPDGKHIGFTTGRADYLGLKFIAHIFDPATGQIQDMASGHDNVNDSIAWSPDSKYIVSGSSDTTAKVWDVASGQEIATFKHNDVVQSVAWSPDGKYIATGGADYNVWIWQAPNMSNSTPTAAK